ncbi:MAG TPA: NAD(P)H-binding protein [Alphaproteobacteria bacterium]|jgi:uncharacterized protein YbjT (DUF2867 family)|nr:NAD(P)H-binding protein [Alphaproteobacteria bacterium]
MILVTGASGHVGGAVARLLTESGDPLRLMVRDAAKAPVIAGAEIAEADYADPASLGRAMNGVRTALVVSGSEREGKRALLHRNVFEAAARAGIGHLVYLSFQGASASSKFAASRDHHLSEGYLRETGIPATVLRDNFYLDLIPELAGADGLIRGPAGDGRVAWVARDDVAAVAAAVLRDPARYPGVYELTGPEALSLAETTHRLSSLPGRKLGYHDESLEEGRAWRLAQGAPEWLVDGWLGSYLAIAAGELEPVSDVIERILGRPPQGLEAYFARHPELLAGPGEAG